MKRFATIAILLLISTSLLLANDLKIGSNAPTISIQEWLAEAPGGDVPFKGKTVVLEFWGTWCGPCVRAIPHLNKLVDKYQNDDLIFVSITKETKSKVAKFMKKKQMKAFVALDNKGKTNKAYQIRYIPKAYIIDPNGLIIWGGHPAHLTNELFDYYHKNNKMPLVAPAKATKKSK